MRSKPQRGFFNIEQRQQHNMKTSAFLPCVLALAGALQFSAPLSAQVPLSIPGAITDPIISLTLAPSQKEFYPGMMSPTMGYNGAYLGPTIMLDAGTSANFMVQNDLDDSTTTHWHGLHVSPQNDGSPHQAIPPGQMWMPAFDIMDKAGTYWYHPHLHGKTMEQVIAGAAGMIIVRDAEEAALDLPRTYGVDDIPLVLQFKTFDVDGMLMLDDEMDNEVLVNGDVMPAASLPAQVVRLRLLNGSSHRTFRIGIPMMGTFSQITSDGGLLDAPVTLSRLTLSPGERAEILVDLTGMQGMGFDVMTYGSELPVGVMGGPPAMGMMPGPLDNTDFAIMTVSVTVPTADPMTTIPSTLTMNMPWPEASATQTFNVQMQETPMGSNEWFLNGLKFDMERIDFNTNEDATVIWELENMSMMGHPFHIHGGQFYVLDVDGAAPPANLQGRKDVVLVEPMSTIRVIMKYEDFNDPLVPYMFHCHILSHEDNGMMGQFIVDAATGITEKPANEGLFIYPNPADQEIVTLSSAQGNVDRVRLFDGTGRVVLDQRFGASQALVNTAQLTTGVYSVEVHSKSGVQRAKLVKP